MLFKMLITLVLFTLGMLSLISCGVAENSKVTVRAGHFPNITHAQGVIGQANGAFQKALKDKANVDWKIFNSGTPAIEALFAGELDIAYIGPNPAINGYVKSEGEVLRIISGAASGGAALVVKRGAGIKSVKDFGDKKLAAPSIGNTQYVALVSWLNENGYKLKDKGGNVEALGIANPDQLTLFIKDEIDGAWTVEPWVSRLVFEGGGEVFLEESELWEEGKYVTTNLIVSSKFLKENPDVVKTWLRTHIELTDWINKNPEEAKKILNEEIKRETGEQIPENILNASLKRIEFTYDPLSGSLFKSAEDAYKQGFLGSSMPDLSNIYDISLLNEVLKEKGLKTITQ